MRAGFYPKLALNSIRKNKRLYMPYILTCIGMVMMYYIILFLQYSDTLSYIRGAVTIRSMLGFGGWVIAVFAAIFLFYTNSFLIRRRKKEFGLYNILGMGKWNIGRILFWETLIIAVASLGIGLVLGIVLSKLAELGLVNVLREDVTYTLSVSPYAIIMTIGVFCVIYVILFLNTLRQIRRTSAIALLHSDNVGEKPPKGNWFFGICGFILLAAAYYISVSTKDPISALGLFFVAVIMVIIGTYFLFVTGSVLFCRILQKKKGYYYKPNHFVSVASMVYRMKRNGAGLASICILATMVLVMISSTTSLYFGAEDSLRNRYPKEININIGVRSSGDLGNENIAAIRNTVAEVCRMYDVEPVNINDYRYAVVAGLIEDGVVQTDVTKISEFNIDTYSNVFQIYMVPLEDYNKIMGENEALADGEAILYTYRSDYTLDTLGFEGGKSFSIKKKIDKFIDNGEASANIIPSMYLVVPDMEAALEGLESLSDYSGNQMVLFRWVYEFDTQAESDIQINMRNSLSQNFSQMFENEEYGIRMCSVESREENTADFYGTYGSLFFLGIILSIVFIFAAVLIIYYKQISEGYEDQSRFEIMQKVGMTKKEIRRSINSQLLTVFFLPLISAGIHLAFAFPIIRRLLLLFNLNNVTLFAVTTIVSFAVFAAFYTLVYRITSNAYYNIVSGAKEDR